MAAPRSLGESSYGQWGGRQSETFGSNSAHSKVRTFMLATAVVANARTHDPLRHGVMGAFGVTGLAAQSAPPA